MCICSRHCRVHLSTFLVFISFGLRAPAAADLDPSGCSRGVGQWPYGPSYTLDVSADTIYLGQGAILTLLDRSDPTAPLWLGEVVLPGPVWDVAVAQDLAFVATGEAGLTILDVLDPTSPTVVGSYGTATPAFSVAVAADAERAFVGLQLGEVLVLSVGDGTNPTLLGSTTVSSANGLQNRGDLLYIAGGSAGFRIVDISDPGNPQVLSTLATGNAARALDVSGGYAYVGTGSGLEIIDVSDPEVPVFRGSFATGWGVQGVHKRGIYAALATEDEGLWFLDISDPTDPVSHGSIDLPGWTSDVRLVQGEALVADGAHGLQVVDRWPVYSPTVVGTWEGHGDVHAATVVGNTILAVEESRGLRVLDFTDKARPVALHLLAFDGPMAPATIRLSGPYALVTGNRELRVIDISTPTALVEVATVPLASNPLDAALTGNLLVLAMNPGMVIYDLSAPSTPTAVGSFDSPASSSGVAARDSLGLVAAGSFLHVIDLSVSPPTEIGSFEASGPTKDIEIVSDTAYLLGNNDLQVVDLSTPNAPTELGRTPLNEPDPWLTWRLTTAPGRAYVAHRAAGLKIYDVSIPEAPTQIGRFTGPGHLALRAWDVAISDPVALFPSTLTGIQVAEACTPPLFLDGFESGDTTAWSP